MPLDATLQALARMPIPVDPWQNAQVGNRNDGPYKAGYLSLPVQEEGGNPLVDVSRCGLLSADLYFDQWLEGETTYAAAQAENLLFSRALLREGHAKRMQRADAFFRAHGLALFIRSGWRHPKTQQLAREVYSQRTSPEDADDRLFAPVQKNAAPPPHATGACADIELVMLDQGQALPMHVTLCGQAILGNYALEKAQARYHGGVPTAVQATLGHRRLLYHVLCTPGVVFAEHEVFVGHPGEFWHFGDVDPLSAFLQRQPKARCGELLPLPTAYFRAAID